MRMRTMNSCLASGRFDFGGKERVGRNNLGLRYAWVDLRDVVWRLLFVGLVPVRIYGSKAAHHI